MKTLNSAYPISLAPTDLERLHQLRTGQLAGVRRLDLACGLTEFPAEIFQLADSLEVLNLSGNALRCLPDDLHRLHQLRVLFCSNNCFSELPEVLGRCRALRMVGFKANQIVRVPSAALSPALRWLILTDNRIEALPDSLGQCSAMQKLMLSGNQLQHLPETMANCQQLELLRIAANRLKRLPDWLLTLPRLAWLACAGNPFSEVTDAAALAAPAMPLIDWQTLRLDQKVGEGASGVIHLGTWQPGPTELPAKFPADQPNHRRGRAAAAVPTPVAVKLFKGAITSDGLPQSEMAACMAAGSHPNLVGLKGCIVGHPDGVEGLVMAPIDPVFKNLAGPPSLDSCTRDIYPADKRFALPAVLAIALAIAGATAHLHRRGILHGDLYAHNILWDGQAGVLLGDFGAASFFTVATHAEQANAQALQRLEVRAFGYLLEELLERCEARPQDRAAVRVLSALQQRCLQDDPRTRPEFAEIRDRLTQIL